MTTVAVKHHAHSVVLDLNPNTLYYYYLVVEGKPMSHSKRITKFCL